MVVLILGYALIFRVVSIELWSCLFTTKISYAQLFKRSHSNGHIRNKGCGLFSYLAYGTFIFGFLKQFFFLNGHAAYFYNWHFYFYHFGFLLLCL